MKTLISIGFSVLFLVSAYNAFSQKAPIKYGKVDIEDLQMTEYEADPSAAAVVLCSYGYFDAESFQFKQNYRVKILKKEGYDLATRKFQTWEKSSVKGKTFNLVDGEVVADKLSNQSIFKEKVMDDYYLLNVAMPNVKEGSVIDLEITYDGFPYVWYFQEEIPVKWSELQIERMEYLSYKKNFFGYEKLKLNGRDRWIAENIPAFHDEPFMDSRENYITKFEFDITSINIPGYYYNDLASNWEEVSETLMDSPYFGKILQTGTAINKKAKEIEENFNTDEEKLKAAIDYLRTIEYNGLERCWASENTFKLTLKEMTGSSADINLMLIKLLKKMNFTVHPVALSTKENGYLSPVNPSLRKLNYVVAYVKVDDKYVLVDATDELLPYYMLPEQCLNWRGRLIDEGLTQWVDLNPEKKNKELVYYDLLLNEDMSLSGNLSYKRNDYAAYHFRKKIRNFSDTDAYVESLTDKYHGLEIEDVEIKNMDDIYLPVTDNYKVTITDQVYEMDSTLYLSLALFEKEDENPFKAKERKYPVDFTMPIDQSGIVKITLPKNYEVVEIPKSAKFVLPNEAASFTYATSHIGNSITLQFKLKVNKTLFVLEEYDHLKAFYNEIINKEAEPLVIKIKGHEL